MQRIRKFLNTKFAGNALLLILIISVVMVAILLSISDRLISTEFSIARTSEYERSLLYSEGFINNVVSLHDNVQFKNCVQRTTLASQSSQFVDISDCFSQSELGDRSLGINLSSQIDNQQLKVYARATQDNRVSITRGQTVVVRLVESFTNPQSAPVIGDVRVNIQNCGNDGMRNFIFSRVGWYNNNIIVGKYRVDNINSIANRFNITITNRDWMHVINKSTSSIPVSYHTLYISARYIGSNANCQIGFDVYDSTNSRIIASTRSFEILLQSDVYLGANSLVSFRLPTGGRTFLTDSIYDYVYFEQ